jgi:cyclic-di-AMP phosphodiesterase PgpH
VSPSSTKSQDSERRRSGKSEGLRHVITLLLGLVLIAGALVLFPPVTPAPRFDFQLNQVTSSADEVIAPIDFRVPVDERLLQERRVQASLQVAPVYREDQSLAPQIHDRLDRLDADLVFLDQGDSLSTEIADLDSIPKVSQRHLQLQRLQPDLDFTILTILLESSDRGKILERVRSVSDSLIEQGILDTRSPLAGGGMADDAVFILLGSEGEREIEVGGLLDQDQLETFLKDRARGWNDWRSESGVVFRNLSRSLLRPNLSYLEEETSLRKRLAAETVPTHLLIPQGVRILGPNLQVTQDHLDKLSALESQLGLQPESWMRILEIYTGRILLLLFLIFLASRFLILYRADFFLEWRRILFLVMLELLFLFASKMILNLGNGAEYLLPIAFVAMLVAGLYDSVMAMIVTLAAILFLGVSTSLPPSALLVSFLVGGAAIFSMGQIRSRLQLYKSIFYISLAYLLAIAAVELGRAPILDILTHGLMGMAGGLVCAWLVLPITPLLERFLDITTELSLLELTDLNRPILKRMKVEAPGTFQHSLVVSNLAEAAADDIGARALLAKVCAYYHDIGKLAKPDYFGENVRATKNKHDKLTPNMSALIISAHVKEGLELAERIKLPSIVAAGIPEHHGTTVMQYFYRKAQDADPKSTVRAEDFRYPGPRPQSPETAILMMADTVEATVRSLDAPTPSKIRNVVTDAIEKRLKDGQLEQCGLSIQNLATIRESFITTFLSIYHPRIKYPSEKE